MHILHVFDHSIPLHSGYTFRSKAILQEQRKLGWTTSHLTGPKHNLARAEHADTIPLEEDVEGLHFFRSAAPHGLLGRLPALNQIAIMQELEKRLSEVAKQIKPDLIQAHSPALNAIPAIKVGKRLGIPVAYEVRAFWEDAAVSHGTSKKGGLRYRLGRALETRALKGADAITCICEGLREDIVSRGISADKIGVIPNAVDLERFEPVSERDNQLATELGLGDKPVIGFIGSFYAYEGIDLLLKAVPLLQEQLPDIQILLVGGGPMESSLRTLTQELSLEDRVHFIGRVPHEQVNRYYSLIDISVYARNSLRITELVTPLKPLESMAQKCLFVASDVGGHRELIRHGETGILFKADDVEDLTHTLLNMFQDRSIWPTLREKGRNFVELERTWERSIANYRPLYEKLLASRSG